ncbi:MAG: rod shape-determining protein MreC [Comamonadaceae bacterium]|nr:rod shape-determining protein MreC [Comamonadaceae bacterium]
MLAPLALASLTACDHRPPTASSTAARRRSRALAFFGLVSIAAAVRSTRATATSRRCASVRGVVALSAAAARRSCPARRSRSVGDYFATQRALADENAALQAASWSSTARQRSGCERCAQENDAAARRCSRRRRGSRRGGGGRRGALHGARPVRAEARSSTRARRTASSPARPVIDADGVVGQVTRVYPLHGGGDAAHRQGPRGARCKVDAQRRARGALRRRGAGHAAGAALHAAERRHPGRRRCWSPRASTAPIRRASPVARGRARRARHAARCSRASRARAARPASTAASSCWSSRDGRGAPPPAGGARPRPSAAKQDRHAATRGAAVMALRRRDASLDPAARQTRSCARRDRGSSC